MLQYIRDRMTGLLAGFILVVLIIPFAFVGVSNYFQANTQNLVAMVNEEPIEAQEFQTSFQNYLRQMSSLFGANFDITQFDQPVRRREHLERMINQRLLRQSAVETGLAVSREELQVRIASVPAFQIDGQFNHEAYVNLLRASGLTPKQYETDLAQDMAAGQLGQIIQSSAISTAYEVEKMNKLRNQTRSFQAVTLQADSYQEQASVSEDDIQAYYDDNPGQFMSEEQVIVDYVEMSGSDFDHLVTPTDEALQAVYDQQQQRFINPEQRLASHILINVAQDADDATIETARQRAEDLAKQAIAGADFAALAQEYSEDLGSASSGGDLGWVEPGVMVSAFEDALYQMEAGEISDPVRSGFGYHVIYLREIQPSTGMSFADARPQLLEEYLESEAESLYLEKAGELVNYVYEDSSSLQTAAENLDLEVKTEGPFGRSGGEGIAAYPMVAEAAFSELVLGQRENSEQLEIEPNHIVFIRIAEHLPSELQPLDEVRQQAQDTLLAQTASELAKAEAEVWLQQLQSGAASLDALALEKELEVTSAEAAGRRDAQYGLALLEQVFLLPKPAAESGDWHVVTVGDDSAVVSLTQVTPGATAEDEAQLTQLQRQIANTAAAGENTGMLDYLRANAEIEVFEQNL